MEWLILLSRQVKAIEVFDAQGGLSASGASCT